MSDEQTSHILYLSEQVLRFAAEIDHKHTTSDITDISSKYAPLKHDSASEAYGKGTQSKYGHLKINDNVTGTGTDNAMPVTATGIVTYVSNQISNIASTLRTELQNKLNIKQTVDSTSTHQSSGAYNIPTTQAVWQAISDYKDLLIGVDLARPKSINKNINDMTDAGYFIQTGVRSFSYGGENINYTNALIKVEKQSNRVIQHVCATDKFTSGGQTIYKINGRRYTRWGATSVVNPPTWNAWEVEHKPYTRTIRACNLGPGVDEGSIEVFENTSGFIIHWDQHNAPDDRYPVSSELYEYINVCEFKPPLPITGPYVFGNLIGRFDIKIEAHRMQIRSNVNKGGRIIEMHETWFVPRNQ